jgi:hypothetical protein
LIEGNYRVKARIESSQIDPVEGKFKLLNKGRPAYAAFDLGPKLNGPAV